jgi:hypothetical protein
MSINLTVVTLYVVNLWMRWNNPGDLQVPFWLSLLAIGLLLISGWLGGKMVYELGVAVDPRALEPGEVRARTTREVSRSRTDADHAASPGSGGIGA